MFDMIMDFSIRYILQHKHIHLSMDVPIGMWLLGGAYE
nr:MAG TPA: hypothetical protein [Caudoviricetes sp.]